MTCILKRYVVGLVGYRTKWFGDLDEREKLNSAAAAAGKKEL